MRCKESQNYMMKFFDKEINDIEEAQLKQHLKNCMNCSKEFDSLNDIFASIEQDSDIEPPEDFEHQVMCRIQRETKMYKKSNEDNSFVFNILLIAVSFIFVIFFGGILWESLSSPINVFYAFDAIVESLKIFFSAAVSMVKGILIAIVGFTASIYKNYYYAYIVLGIILFMSLRLFFRMIKSGNVRTVMDNGGIQ